MKLNGKKIAVYRMKKGLSLKALSELSGIDAGTINRLEHGKASPRPRTVKALCEALEVSFEELFTIVDQPSGR